MFLGLTITSLYAQGNYQQNSNKIKYAGH